MNKVLRVRKTGTGTEDNPIRPDLDSIPELAEFHKALQKLRQLNIDIRDISFYTVQVKFETNNEFEIEIKFPDESEIKNKVRNEAFSVWKKLKDSIIGDSYVPTKVR